MSPIWLPGMTHADDMPADGSIPPAPSWSPRSWIRPALVLFALVAAAVILLRLEGRLWVCTCGEVRLWVGEIYSAHNSQHLFDPYTFTHLLHGVMFYWLLAAQSRRVAFRWQLVWTVGLESVWEVIENSPLVIDRYREATIALGYVGDTVLNSISDILTCGIGFALAYRLGVLKSVVLFVLVESVLLLTIRDGLVLNIIMLIYPFEGVLEWQLGGR